MHPFWFCCCHASEPERRKTHMQYAIPDHDFQENLRLSACRIEKFFQQFTPGAIRKTCDIIKINGVTPTALPICLFSLPLQRLNINRYFSTQRNTDFAKDAVYEFMRSSRFRWRRFENISAADPANLSCHPKPPALPVVPDSQLLVLDVLAPVVAHPRSLWSKHALADFGQFFQ